MTTEYAFDSSTDLGREQLNLIEELLDEVSTRFIGEVLDRPNLRCLDLGAGSGTISRWLAGRVGPGGQVGAVDIDTTYLTVPSEVTVFRHDINDGLPVEGPFDVIVARLLLMHLHRRDEILAELAAALAPGGRLIVGDVVAPKPVVVDAPTPEDAEFFADFLFQAATRVGQPAGMDIEWGYRIADGMAAAGLSDVDTTEYRHCGRGGEAGLLLYSNYVRQLEASALAGGFSAADLDRFHALARDPRMSAYFYPFICARGRRSL